MQMHEQASMLGSTLPFSNGTFTLTLTVLVTTIDALRHFETG